MNASNKRRINEKKCGVYSRAAFNNIFACPCGVYSRAAFIRGRRLFEGGVYSSNYGMRIRVKNDTCFKKRWQVANRS